MVDAAVQIRLDALSDVRLALARRRANAKRKHKVVLLGEQSASNTGGVGSNPTDLAAKRKSDRGPGGEATV